MGLAEETGLAKRKADLMTVLLQNLYQQPNLDLRQADAAMHFASGGAEEQDKDAQRHFDDFFEEVFVELDEKYGEIEEMNVCDNLGEHMIGNVYVKFCREEDAMKGADDLNNRWFGQNPIYAELSPVTDFREACCRQYEMGECSKGGFCNFMHLKPISRELRRRLYGRRGGRTGVGGGEGYRGRVAEPSQRRLPLEDAESYINVKIGTVEKEEDGRREDFERRYHSPTRDRSRRYR